MTNFPITLADVLTAGYIVRRPGLTGYWPFNLDTGADYSGFGDTATFIGTASAGGISGNGRSFLVATDAMDI